MPGTGAPAPSHRAESSVKPLAIALVWVVGGTVLQLLRQSGVPATDTVWAEDGSVFLRDALSLGAFGPVLEPYAGYLHLLPRFMVGLVSLGPPSSFAAALAIGSALTVTLLSVYVYVTSRSLVRTAWMRSVIVIMTVALPALGWESMNNTTNLQWSLIFPCVLALATLPTSGQLAAGSLVAFFAVTSAPTTMVLAPLALWHLVRGPREPRVVAGSFAAGLLLQLSVIIAAGEDPVRAATSTLQLPGLYGLRVATSLYGGEWLLPIAWPTLGWLLAFGGLAVASGLLVYGWIRLPHHRITIGLLGLYSVVLFCFPVYVRGTTLILPMAKTFTFDGSKWVIGPVLLLAMATFVILEASPGWVWRTAEVAFTVVVAAAMVIGFRVENARTAVPRWSVELQAAQNACESRIEDAETIPIAPLGWTTRVPCVRLVHGPA